MNTRRRSKFLTGLFGLLMLFSLPHCDVVDIIVGEPSDNQDTLELAALAGLIPTPGDHFNRMYYINPLFSNDATNMNLVFEAGAEHVFSGRKKLILVHGWDFTDTNDKGYPDIGALKTRITTDTWTFFLTTTEFQTITSALGYDVYLYDYLTSDGIDVNGARFRAKLDSLFASSTEATTIFAHSMGGLVTRTALYTGDRPSYLTRVISAGTPYHGSPWASGAFQGDRSILGTLASFLTNTTGGLDLAWDNYDGSLDGASNAKLTALNAQTARDDLLYVYYGSLPTLAVGAGAGDANGTLNATCPLLGSTFAESDCIVPVRSAQLAGNTPAISRDLGNYDHFDVNLMNSTVRTILLADLP